MKSQVGIEPLWSKLFMMADSYDVGDEKTKKMIQNLIEEYSL